MTSLRRLGKISVRSDHEVEWVIDNFFSYTGDDTSYISPQFNIKGIEWFLKFYPNGRTSGNSTAKRIKLCSTGWISLYLYSVKPLSPIGVSCNLGVKKVDGNIEYRLTESVWEIEENKRWGTSEFLERSELQRRETELMLSNALTVTCRLRTLEDFESFSGPGTLSQDLVNMFLSKNSCDATLNVKGEEFPAHRFILSARSSVFRSMFEVDMREKTTGTVDIPDCDPESFREFLLYLYSDKIEKVPRDTFELYKIADKYNVEDLKSYCALSILLNLSVDNVLDAYSFGCQYNMGGVKLKSQNFFKKNFPKIVQTAKWKELLEENPTTANKLLARMAKEMEKKK